MGAFSIWHVALVVVVLVVLFGGRGKISGLMGDTAKGIKAFKKGMKEDDDTPAASKTIDSTSTAAKKKDPAHSA